MALMVRHSRNQLDVVVEHDQGTEAESGGWQHGSFHLRHLMAILCKSAAARGTAVVWQVTWQQINNFPPTTSPQPVTANQERRLYHVTVPARPSKINGL